MVLFGSRETREPIASTPSSDASLAGTRLPSSELSHLTVDAPLLHEGTTRSSSESDRNDSSQNSCAIMNFAHSNLNRISIFRGLSERVQRTVRGSADDIGWLQRASDMPPVEDGTERFMGILLDIRHGLHRLLTSMVCLLVPGLFSNQGPLYFVNTKNSLSKMGVTCHIVKIHSEASVENNAREIKDYIEEIHLGTRKKVQLLGHSKGGIDAAAALSIYWTDLKDKVAGLAFAQSPYGGSPIASDILREGQLGDYVNARKLMELLMCKVMKCVAVSSRACALAEQPVSVFWTLSSLLVRLAKQLLPGPFGPIWVKGHYTNNSTILILAAVLKGDIQALEDLTYERRKELLRKYRLPRELPVVSFLTEASISPAVLATLSLVAQVELPTFSAGQPATLPVVMPLGAVMAGCAQLLKIRYGEKSDGLVTCRDALVPCSVVVRPQRKVDHAWMVYSSLNDDPSEADASQVCEALLTLLVEVGQRRRYEFAQG